LVLAELQVELIQAEVLVVGLDMPQVLLPILIVPAILMRDSEAQRVVLEVTRVQAAEVDWVVGMGKRVQAAAAVALLMEAVAAVLEY
jgi:hypothetical protein